MQHRQRVGQLGVAVGQIGAYQRFVHAFGGQFLLQAQSAAAAAFAVDKGFGVALVRLPLALGQFGQQAVDFVFAFGMWGKPAFQFQAAVFAAGEQIECAGFERFAFFHGCRPFLCFQAA